MSKAIRVEMPCKECGHKQLVKFPMKRKFFRCSNPECRARNYVKQVG